MSQTFSASLRRVVGWLAAICCLGAVGCGPYVLQYHELPEQPQAFKPVEATGPYRAVQPPACKSCPTTECRLFQLVLSSTGGDSGQTGRERELARAETIEHGRWWVCTSMGTQTRSDGCPMDLPQAKSPCGEAGQVCRYGIAGGWVKRDSETQEARCGDSGWLVKTVDILGRRE